MEKVAIIIPIYNEEKRITKTLKSYISYFRELKNKGLLDFVFIMVLNNCSDNSEEVILKQKIKEMIILNFKKGGKGFAVTEGFKEALKGDFEIIGFVDADGSTPPEAFYDLIKFLGNKDGVIANRYDKKSKISPKQPIFRQFISRIFNFIVRILFLLPHKDTQCGAKIFRRDLIKKIINKIGSSEWSFDIDLLFYARYEKAKIKSIPTTWHDEKGSKINLKKTPIKMFLSILRLRIIHSFLKDFLRIYQKIPEKYKLHHR